MACSRRAARRHRAAACALALAGVLAAAAAPLPAWAAASIEDRVAEPVSVTSVSAGAFGIDATADVAGGEDGAAEAPAALALARFMPAALSTSCSPSSIDAGIDCGMDWMCGIEPCLCGSSDAWGGCSCNGTETVQPEVSYASSDEGVVRVAEAFGRTWLVPVGPGEAYVRVTASLEYHETTTVDVPVRIDGLALADAALAGCVLAAAAVVAGAALGMRAALRRRRRSGQGEGGCE